MVPKTCGAGVLVAMMLAAPVMFAAAASAQTNPSADQLIQALTPTTQATKPIHPRGLHRLGDAAAPSPAPAASLNVQFTTGSAELTPEAMATLDELGKALSSNQLAAYHFRIEGHTDTVGSKVFNKALSERRAEAVVTYIEQKFSVDGSRLKAVGYGSSHLLVPTPDQTPEARNRRVQVVNLGA